MGIWYTQVAGTLGSAQSSYSYSYGNADWKDQLTSYRGSSISYDAIGNPGSYFNGSYYNLMWSKGRRLTAVAQNGSYDITQYSYNADGIRTGKNRNGVVTEYILSGSRIVAEKRGSTVIRYWYDGAGSPVGMKLDGETYLYEKNLQGDIVGIYNSSGTRVVSYAYDAWGNVVSGSYSSGALC